MDQQSELEVKRRDVKEAILGMRETILLARIVNGLGRIFQKGTAGYWLSNLVLLNLILFGPWTILGSLLKETEKNAAILAPSIIAIEFSVFGLLLSHIIVQQNLNDIAARIVDKINDVDDFLKLLHWLKSSLSYKNMFTFILPFAFLWTCLGIGGMSLPFHEFVGVGLSLTVILVGLVAGMAFYVPFWVGALASKLKEYHYDMNAFSPAGSEIVHGISEIVTKCIYAFALFFGALTFISSSNLVYEQLRVIFAVPFILLAWIGITSQFILTRSSLRAIVNRAKWKTLNKLQIKMNSLAVNGDLSDEETAGSFLRLAEIHSRVVASATNIFALKSVLTFISQLMLPLLGLLLTNLDKILPLFF